MRKGIGTLFTVLGDGGRFYPNIVRSHNVLSARNRMVMSFHIAAFPSPTPLERAPVFFFSASESLSKQKFDLSPPQF